MTFSQTSLDEGFPKKTRASRRGLPLGLSAPNLGKQRKKDEEEKETKSCVPKHVTLGTRSLTRTQFYVHNDAYQIKVLLTLFRASGGAVLGTQRYRCLFPISLKTKGSTRRPGRADEDHH